MQRKLDIVVGFPLRGEWITPNTPGKKIPSHGTDLFGESYAYDFIQVDWERRGRPAYDSSFLRYLIFGVPLDKCYCWGKEIYAPCDGEVICAEDGYHERQKVHLFSDLFVALKNSVSFNLDRDGIQAVAGNYIVLKSSENVYVAFAHLQKGSVSVSINQKVKRGDVIGKIGHSGNSTTPHLHFQVMDNSDLKKAKGIPCAFEEYEKFQDGQWKKVLNGVPSDKYRIRSVK